MADELSPLLSIALDEVAQALGVPRELLPIEAQQAITRAVYEAHRRGMRRRARRSSSMTIEAQSDKS